MMNWRSLILLVGVFAFSNAAISQSKYGPTSEDSLECLKNLSLLQEFMKQKEYDAAYRSCKDAFTLCPAASKNLYIYGPKIMKDRIKNAADDATKKAQADSLFMMYDKRIEYFGKECFVKGRKGMDMMRYDKKNVEGAYNTLKASVDMCQEKSEAYVLSSYYTSIYNMYRKEKVEKDLLLTEYVVVMGFIEKNMAKLAGDDAKTTKKRGYYEAAKQSVNEIFFKVAECPEIERIMGDLIKESPEDMELKKSALKLFDKKDCTSSPLYLELAEAVHRDSPSHESAYSLGMIYAKKKQFSRSLDFLKEAVELCTDCPEMTKYLEKAGQVASAAGSHGTARSFANKLLSAEPGNSEAYVIIGNVISASGSGCDEPQSWGVNWLAYDYYQKAGATSRMNACAARFPESGKAFFHQLSKGQSFNVTCNGLNETTTVRTR